MDRAQWAARALHRGRPAGADRRRADELYGAQGAQLVRRRHRLRRRHQRLHRRRRSLDPTQAARPSTRRSARRPSRGRSTDVIADGVADRRHLRQGRRQRAATRPSTLQAFAEALRQARPGGAPGRTSARKNDPEAPTTVRASASPTRRPAPFAKRGLAMPDPGSVQRRRPSPPPDARSVSARTAALGPSTRRLRRGARARARRAGHASNWELVPARTRRPATRSP